ncbi:hypothetical protein B5566_02585 [Mycobacterium sp. MHSD3]|nr:hypothetical protein B5566_02585 [Mycobacterium sp. MHSD3]
MATITEVDIQAIVGEMPGRACEVVNKNAERFCDKTATCIARVHIKYPNTQTCQIEVHALCAQHLQEVQEVIARCSGNKCSVCGRCAEDLFFVTPL